MNTDELKGKWEQVKGKVKEKWGKLTNDDIDVIQGKKEQLIGKVRERYGFAKEQAEREVDTFLGSCVCSSTSSSVGDSKPITSSL